MTVGPSGRVYRVESDCREVTCFEPDGRPVYRTRVPEELLTVRGFDWLSVRGAGVLEANVNWGRERLVFAGSGALADVLHRSDTDFAQASFVPGREERWVQRRGGIALEDASGQRLACADRTSEGASSERSSRLPWQRTAPSPCSSIRAR